MPGPLVYSGGALALQGLRALATRRFLPQAAKTTLSRVGQTRLRGTPTRFNRSFNIFGRDIQPFNPRLSTLGLGAEDLAYAEFLLPGVYNAFTSPNTIQAPSTPDKGLSGQAAIDAPLPFDEGRRYDPNYEYGSPNYASVGINPWERSGAYVYGRSQAGDKTYEEIVGEPDLSLPATPPVSEGGTPPSAPDVESGPAGGAREGMMAIQRQYNNLLRDLRGMYQTSETEEERERIRMMLADIEAQKDAGLEAISTGYASTEANIRERAGMARAGGEERAAAASERLSGVGSDLERRLVEQQVVSAAANRGLGVGAAQVDPMNEWVGLINTLAPVQQNYLTSIGDITGEGIDWMADTASLQGQAQAADLQRLAFSTATGAELAERQRIADRIQRERELERQALTQIGLASLSAGQSAAQAAADLALRQRALEADIAAQQAEQSGRSVDIAYSMGLDGSMPEEVNNYFLGRYGRNMTPEEYAIASDAYQLWLRTEGLTTEQGQRAAGMDPNTYGLNPQD